MMSAFGTIILGLMGIGVLYVLWSTFISDWVSNKREEWSSSRGKQSAVDKIALVKLASNDPKDIEKFVTENADFLSMDTVKKLVARIENIRDERVIAADDMLKQRIDSLEEETIPINGRQGRNSV